MSRLALVLLALVGSLAMTARADTPANCSYNEVVGTWLFLIGPGGGTAAQS